MAKKDKTGQTEAQETENLVPETDDGNSETSKVTEERKADDEEPSAPEKEALPKTVKMTLRHKSHTQFYHRAGLAISKAFSDYDVPSEHVEKIKADKWIEIKDIK